VIWRTSKAAASVGQGLLMGHYTQLFEAYGLGVGQVLLTADDVTSAFALSQCLPDFRPAA
jgi:glutamate 5-kinase